MSTTCPARPPASDSADDILERVHAVMHAYRSLQYRFLRDGPYEITHMDSKVLGFFGRHPGATQSDLAQHSGRDKAQLARLIKGLRDRGLLAAEVDAQDRRHQRLSLTEAGKSVQRALQAQARRTGLRAMDSIDAREAAGLARLLDRMLINLTKAAEEEAGLP